MTQILTLSTKNLPEIKELFRSVFTLPPWNDDWSNDVQLEEYLLDVMTARNPLNLGFYKDKELIGLSLGYIKHWCSGTEYFINELCIRPELQGNGYGTIFLQGIEDILRYEKIGTIFLLTERDVPAYEFYKQRGFEETPNQTAFFKNID